MKIYIDESGIFKALSGTASKLSCVAALVLPSSEENDIFLACDWLADASWEPAFGD